MMQPSNMYTKKMKKLYGPTSLCLEPLNVSIQQEKKLYGPTSLDLYDAAFKCVHQANEEAVWAHFTLLGAFKCVHPASE